MSARSRTILAALGGSLGGFLLAGLVFLDPLGLRDALGGHHQHTTEEAAADSELWTCGMHPNVIQKEPGFCPICQMDLVPLNGDVLGGDTPSTHVIDDHAGHDHSVSGVWTCPIHPEIVEHEPGTCPIGGGDLVHQDVEERPTADAQAPEASHGISVRIDPTVVQNMNVRTARIERRDLHRPIRTVGSLDFDQERMVTVTTKYSGWVEKVYVNYVGEPVEKGEPLFEIYSPELVQTEQELLSALDFARDLHDAPDDSRRRAESLVEAARTRLGYWDIAPEQITRLEETREVFRTLTVVAPASGLVMKRMAGLEGMAVMPGMEIFHLADLRSLWLSVEIFEDQVAWIREGAPAEISLPYFPGTTFRGTVRFLEPEFSEATRTLRVKIEVPNRSGQLRKGMFATVTFDPVAVSDAVAVPSQAILRTGERNVVVLALGGGRFAPREVVVGHEAGGYAEILRGVEEGDEVVTSAQFLLDSESKLREAIRKMVAEGGGSTGGGHVH